MAKDKKAKAQIREHLTVMPEKPVSDCPPFTREQPEGSINDRLDESTDSSELTVESTDSELTVDSPRLDRWNNRRGDRTVACNYFALIDARNFPLPGTIRQA